MMPPSVLLLDNEQFEAHLRQHRQQIIETVTSLYKKSSASNISDSETQTALKSALAKNNVLVADLERVTLEKDDKDERLTDTMMRLLSLEKKIDRSKSVTLAKIEAQALHERSAEQSQTQQEVIENGESPSRPSSRVKHCLRLV